MSIASKIICVGRNYADHAKELGNDVPDNPLLFFKPPSSVNHTNNIAIAEITKDGALGELHFECELCLKIGQTAKNLTMENALSVISDVTLGLDLTLRDIQNTLKQKGHPWERAKAFDGACVLGNWLPVGCIDDFTNVTYTLCINDHVRQKGNTALMLFPIQQLLVNITEQFSLQAGDIIMTGTPKGVGALRAGDDIVMQLHTNQGVTEWKKQVV